MYLCVVQGKTFSEARKAGDLPSFFFSGIEILTSVHSQISQNDLSPVWDQNVFSVWYLSSFLIFTIFV